MFPCFYKKPAAALATELFALTFDPEWEKEDYLPLFNSYVASFTASINTGWGLPKTSPIYLGLQANAYEFAAAKLSAFKQRLKEGITPEVAFATHQGYLATEAQHFTASAQMATKWQGFVANEAKMPYLQYVTANDSEVRESHRVLNNVIQLLSSDFWKTHFPPLGYRCRCTARQLTKATAEASEHFGKALPDAVADNPYFVENSGITGKAFNDKHPYFSTDMSDFNKMNATNIKDAKKNLLDFKSSLKSEEIANIKAWTGNQYIAISQYQKGKLAKDSTAYPILKASSELLENALLKMPKYQGLSHRGETLEIDRFKMLSELKENDIFDFGKTVSGAIKYNEAADFANAPKYSVIFDIYSRKSVYIAEISLVPAESECIFSQKSKFIVLGNTKEILEEYEGKPALIRLRIKLLEL